MQVADRISQIFKLIGDQTRVRILLLLKDEGELNVTTIANRLEMAQSAISHQLKLLREGHLIKNRKVGKVVFYQLDDDHVVQLLEMTKEHVAHEGEANEE